MSFGLSCLVSDIPANREVKLPEDRYFAPGEIDLLSTKLSQFMTRPLSADMRAAQLALIARDYDWDSIAQRTLDVYAPISCR